MTIILIMVAAALAVLAVAGWFRSVRVYLADFSEGMLLTLGSTALFVGAWYGLVQFYLQKPKLSAGWEILPRVLTYPALWVPLALLLPTTVSVSIIRRIHFNRALLRQALRQGTRVKGAAARLTRFQAAITFGGRLKEVGAFYGRLIKVGMIIFLLIFLAGLAGEAVFLLGLMIAELTLWAMWTGYVWDREFEVKGAQNGLKPEHSSTAPLTAQSVSRPPPVFAAVPQTPDKVVRILARSIYRELRKNGYDRQAIVALAAALIQLVTEEMQKSEAQVP